MVSVILPQFAFKHDDTQGFVQRVQTTKESGAVPSLLTPRGIKQEYAYIQETD